MNITEKNQGIKNIRGMLAITTVVVLAFVHISIWGQNSLSIIPLKLTQVTGMMDIGDYNQLADTCMELKYYSCVVDAYKERLALDETKLEHHYEYAKILDRTRQHHKALSAYKKYMDLGGNDLMAMFHYAKALEKVGDYEQSAKMHETTLDADPKVFQRAVSQSYVKLLMQMENYNQAKKFINKTRKKGTNAPNFMDQELQRINKSLLVAKK